MAYIGKTPVIGNFVKLDAISVVNGQAAYTMNNGGSAFTAYNNVNQFLVSLNGVLQAPTDSFTVSGSTLTFASNLATGDVIDFVIVLGNTLDIGTPSDNTVSTAKIVDGAVSSAKLASGLALGKIGQVVQTVKTDIFTSTTASLTDITGFSVAITPSATSSKVLVMAQYNLGVNTGYKMYSSLLRDSTEIYIGDAAGNRVRRSFGSKANANDDVRAVSHIFLDSPNTTSSTTYKIQAYPESGGTLVFNASKSSNDSDQAIYSRDAASITVMEVLA